MILPLIVASVLSVGASQDDLAIVRAWITAVSAHQPGIVDKPLLDVAAQSPANLDTVRRVLPDVLKYERQVETRNDILRRGAVAHTDIALLMPERAAEYLQTGEGRERSVLNPFELPRILYRRNADALVFGADGEYTASAVETAHWTMARMLLRGIYPHPAGDEFVRLWYRAVAALFEESYLLGNATYQLEQALEVLPRDPMLLFYAGAMHEACASERLQSIPRTRPALGTQLSYPSPQEEWRSAERLLGEAVKENAPVEARVRRARVLGRLGKHAEAAAMLRGLEPQLTERRLQYFGALFLGSEEGALGRIEQARAAFERAAALFPTAQSPLMAMSDLLQRSGSRTTAVTILNRIQALPADQRERDDPWMDYFRSFASDAGDQLAAVRAWVNRKEPR